MGPYQRLRQGPGRQWRAGGLLVDGCAGGLASRFPSRAVQGQCSRRHLQRRSGHGTANGLDPHTHAGAGHPGDTPISGGRREVGRAAGAEWAPGGMQKAYPAPCSPALAKATDPARCASYHPKEGSFRRTILVFRREPCLS